MKKRTPTENTPIWIGIIFCIICLIILLCIMNPYVNWKLGGWLK